MYRNSSTCIWKTHRLSATSDHCKLWMKNLFAFLRSLIMWYSGLTTSEENYLPADTCIAFKLVVESINYTRHTARQQQYLHWWRVSVTDVALVKSINNTRHNAAVIVAISLVESVNYSSCNGESVNYSNINYNRCSAASINNTKHRTST